jgi:hypothetical protein
VLNASDVSTTSGPGVADAHIASLPLPREAEARRLLRRALRDADPAAQRFGWQISSISELTPDDSDVGYTGKDGTIFVKVREPTSQEGSRSNSSFYAYPFVLATLVHELVHLSHLGHGKNFYRCLSAALAACGAESWVRREARTHVCGELLNAVCDNDARRARALLTVMPEAAICPRPSGQLPLEYAAHHGRVALTRLLLEARADPTPCNNSFAKGGGMAPLERAAVNGNAKTVALLLAARANVVDVREPKGQSVLDKAIAAAEAGGFAGKGGDWWQVSKVLGNDPPRAISTKDDETRNHGRSRRRKSRGATEAAMAGKRASSMPSLPSLPKIETCRPVALSSLSGSLAL